MKVKHASKRWFLGLVVSSIIMTAGCGKTEAQVPGGAAGSVPPSNADLARTQTVATAQALANRASSEGNRRRDAPLAQLVKATPFTGKVGVELDGIGDGNRARPFVDVAKTLRPWMPVQGETPVPLDANGWPMSDASTVFFDIRPFGAWLGPDQIDDPAKYQPDWSGTYKMSFNGEAVIQSRDVSNFSLANQRYDVKSNTTTVDVIVRRGAGLLVLSFTNTKRTATSPTNSGITNVRLIRPGYAANTRQVFTTEFINSLKPFSTLRFMDWLSTNSQPGFYGDPGHHVLNWSDRHLPTDATQQDVGNKHGAAWEYIIQLGNEANKDIWINIPVAASDDYIRQLALLLKRTLKPNLKVYVEHSNEVWNFSFPQYTYNKLAAVDEVGQGNSPLNNDGSKDQEVWAHRRHAKRLVDASNIFRSVYGDKAINTIIRPVYASWTIFPDAYYADVLKWVNNTYGPPKNLFYAVASAAYFNANKASKTASVDEVLGAMRSDSDNNRKYREAIQKVAASFGLKHFQYEIGPDTGGGSTDNVGNRILANRDPRMREIILHDAGDNWFALGGDLYMYFSHCSPYSRYGAWGLSEDVDNLNTPKWQAIYELLGYAPPRQR